MLNIIRICENSIDILKDFIYNSIRSKVSGNWVSNFTNGGGQSYGR